MYFKRPKNIRLVNNNEINLSYFYNFFLINKKFIKKIFTISLIFSLISLFLIAPKFSSKFQILNRPDNILSSAPSISSLSDIALGTSSSFQYSSILNSNSFMKELISEIFMIDGRKINLVDFFEVEKSYSPKNIYYKFFLSEDVYKQFLEDKVVKILKKSSTFYDDDQGIFFYSIELKNSSAAYAIASKVMDKLNVFSIQSIQTDAYQRRLYLEKRLSNLKLILKIQKRN